MNGAASGQKPAGMGKSVTGQGENSGRARVKIPLRIRDRVLPIKKEAGMNEKAGASR